MPLKSSPISHLAARAKAIRTSKLGMHLPDSNSETQPGPRIKSSSIWSSLIPFRSRFAAYRRIISLAAAIGFTASVPALSQMHPHPRRPQFSGYSQGKHSVLHAQHRRYMSYASLRIPPKSLEIYRVPRVFCVHAIRMLLTPYVSWANNRNMMPLSLHLMSIYCRSGIQ